jgi:hydroxypyruvate reductase
MAIWRAGLDAVRGDHLVRSHVAVRDSALIIGPHRWPLDTISRICVVGAGKAGASMAAGLEQALGDSVINDKQLSGWINVPEDCVRPLQRIQLHAARPAGVNEPTPQGQAGAEEILRRVAALTEDDLCLCLISGGGSALLPAPRPGISLTEKLQVTRHLSAAGASIQELNAVRRQLSAIKGGGLARACRAGRLVALVISDVRGDPLEVIASGPTVLPHDPSQTAQEACEVLKRFDLQNAGVGQHVLATIAKPAAPTPQAAATEIIHLVIGNNRVACEAAAAEAERRAYDVRTVPSEAPTATAEEVGCELAESLLPEAPAEQRRCLICGGEPVVRLVPADQRGLGGRNQQLALAALQELLTRGPQPNPLRDRVLLSGGTDGEDGPTDAAGAVIDAQLVEIARRHGLDPEPFLQRNDAYRFFAPLGGLIKTGPTHTNVCDLRVLLQVGPSTRAGR